MALLAIHDSGKFQALRQSTAAAVPADTLERIACIMGIYQALQLLLPKSADEWIRRPNKAALFGGRPALKLMMRGDLTELLRIRAYLEAELHS